MLHAFARGGPLALARINPAWREQCWAIAALAPAAVLFNRITAGAHLIGILFTDPYWAVASVDLSLLASAVLAIGIRDGMQD